MKLPLPVYDEVRFRIRNKVIYVQVSGHLLTYIGDRIAVQDGCWVWTKASPQFSYFSPDLGGNAKKQVTLQVPTLMFKIYNGPIKHNTYMERTCGNWKCINPEHMEAGTREGKRPRRAGKWVDSMPEMVGQELDPFEVSSMGLGSTLDPKRNSFHFVA